MIATFDFALRYRAAGLSIIPIRCDGTKAPAVSTWKEFQARIPTEAEITSLMNHGRLVGIGILGGKVSGNLEVIDVDLFELFEPFRAIVDLEAPGLIDRLTTIRTPRPGIHLAYRCVTIGGNQPLARRLVFDEKRGKLVPKALIETRGEGGYVVGPGSPAECHDTGRCYEHIAGPPLESVPTITPEERQLLFDAARSFNEYIEPEAIVDGLECNREAAGDNGHEGLSPGDDYNQRAEWTDILTPHGWTVAHVSGDKTNWRRPDKAKGWSATTGCTSQAGASLLCVFSTSTEFVVPLGKTCGTYSKFASYAVLNHGGDFKAATKALAKAGYGEQRERKAASETADGRTLPEIIIGPDEMRVTSEAITALVSRTDIYQRGGVLVEVRESPEPPACIIRPEGGIRAERLPKPRLRELIADSATFSKWHKTRDGIEKITVNVPQTVVDQVEARGIWPGLPALEGIVTSPQFLVDGSILATAGYDNRSGLYLAAECAPVPQHPTKDDAIFARDDLLEVVADFPFGDLGSAAWLAIALTGAARHAIDGPTPLFALDANVRGSGKSLAADAVGIIHTGRQLPRTTAAKDDDEFRKRITSILLAGEPLVLLDNVSGVLGCPSLDALLTSTTWTDRILGLSAMTAVLPAKAIWIATGNNLQFAADTARRTLRIRLESPLENPEERTGFKHPDLLAWVRRERGRLAGGAVTILRAWHLAGRPSMGLVPWGSFDSWSRIVRAAVAWLDLPDPGETRQEVQRESDREAILLRLVLDAWQAADPHGHGLTVGEAAKAEASGMHDGLTAVFAELADRSGKINPRGVGMKLHHLRGRVCNGKYLDRKDGQAGAIWKVKNSQ